MELVLLLSFATLATITISKKETKVNLIIRKSHGCKMPENDFESLIKSITNELLVFHE